MQGPRNQWMFKILNLSSTSALDLKIWDEKSIFLPRGHCEDKVIIYL